MKLDIDFDKIQKILSDDRETVSLFLHRIYLRNGIDLCEKCQTVSRKKGPFEQYTIEALKSYSAAKEVPDYSKILANALKDLLNKLPNPFDKKILTEAVGRSCADIEDFEKIIGKKAKANTRISDNDFLKLYNSEKFGEELTDVYIKKVGDSNLNLSSTIAPMLKESVRESKEKPLEDIIRHCRVTYEPNNRCAFYRNKLEKAPRASYFDVLEPFSASFELIAKAIAPDSSSSELNIKFKNKDQIKAFALTGYIVSKID